MFRPSPPPSGESPPDLLTRLARGEPQALDLVYRAEAGEVYRFALAMCGNPAWAADATQDAFVHLAEGPTGYDAARGPLRAYLCGITRHRLLARWRESHGAAPLDEGDDSFETPATPATAGPETALEREQGSQALWHAIRQLPWNFREAVVLVDLQERPYGEAALIAGIELNTLRTRLHRARTRLAQALAPQPRELQT